MQLLWNQELLAPMKWSLEPLFTPKKSMWRLRTRFLTRFLIAMSFLQLSLPVKARQKPLQPATTAALAKPARLAIRWRCHLLPLQ